MGLAPHRPPRAALFATIPNAFCKDLVAARGPGFFSHWFRPHRRLHQERNRRQPESGHDHDDSAQRQDRLFPQLRRARSRDQNADAPNRIFRIYSMWKPITTVAAMMLVEKARSTQRSLSKYIPAFTNIKVGIENPGEDGKMGSKWSHAKRPITIQDLMRHTSGITYGFFGEGLVKKAYVDATSRRRRFRQCRVRRADRQDAAGLSAGLDMGLQPFDRHPRPRGRGRIGKVALSVRERANARSAGHDRHEFYVGDQAKQARVAEPFPNDRKIGNDADMNDPRMQEMGVRRRRNGSPSPIMRALRRCAQRRHARRQRYLSPKTVAYHGVEPIGPASGVMPGPTTCRGQDSVSASALRSAPTQA